MQALELRKAILELLKEHKAKEGELAPLREEELAKKLGVHADRLEAHFTFLKMGGHVEFLHMPDAHGNRARFVNITDSGEKYLSNPNHFQMAKGSDSPFKVVDKGQGDAVMTDLAKIRSMVEATEWVIDEEKPEILQKLAELEKVLDAPRFDPGAVSGLKMYFERHKWLAPHVGALLRARLGF